MEAWLANPVLLEADADAEYAAVIEINLDELTEPILACPNDPDNVKLLSQEAGKPIDEVFIGSCMTNIGHYRAAAKVLEGQGQIAARLWVCPPTRMDDESLFRFAPGYTVQPLVTALDWSDWNRSSDASRAGAQREGYTLEGNGVALSAPGTGGDPAGGFSKAIEMCNNNGHCRKFDAGTMCPSYRATLDEQHLQIVGMDDDQDRFGDLEGGLFRQVGFPSALKKRRPSCTLSLYTV
jgi:hypothetical protein